MEQSKKHKILIAHLCYLALALLFAANFIDLRAPGYKQNFTGNAPLTCHSLNWAANQLTSSPLQIFDGNAFQPNRYTRAYNDCNFGLLPFFAILKPLHTNPWFAWNILFILSFFLSASGAFFLIHYITRSPAAAFWGGIFWGFNFFHIQHADSLAISSLQWLPLAALYLLKFMRDPSYKHTLLMLLFFILQALSGWQILIITLLILASLCAFQLTRSHFKIQTWKFYATFLIFSILIIAPFAESYMKIKDQGDNQMIAIQNNSPAYTNVEPANFFTPPKETFLGNMIQKNTYDISFANTLYIGVTPLALAIVGLILLMHSNEKNENVRFNIRCIASALLLLIVGYILSLGTTTHDGDWKLPLYYLQLAFPLLQDFCVPQRFALLMNFAILILSGIAIEQACRSLAHKAARISLVTSCILFFIIEIYPMHLDQTNRQSFAFNRTSKKIDEKQKLSRQTLTVLQFPIYELIPGQENKTAHYLLQSLHHKASLVNGHAQRIPRSHLQKMKTLNQLPGRQALQHILENNIDMIILQKETAPEQKSAILEFFQNHAPQPPQQIGDQWLIEIPETWKTSFKQNNILLLPPKNAADFLQWHPPIDKQNSVVGFNDPTQFHPLETPQPDIAYRWSKAHAVLEIQLPKQAKQIILRAALPPRVVENYQPKFKLFMHGNKKELLHTQPKQLILQHRAGTIDFHQIIPANTGKIYLGWQINPINLKQLNIADDDRNLGLQIYWLAIK